MSTKTLPLLAAIDPHMEQAELLAYQARHLVLTVDAEMFILDPRSDLSFPAIGLLMFFAGPLAWKGIALDEDGHVPFRAMAAASGSTPREVGRFWKELVRKRYVIERNGRLWLNPSQRWLDRVRFISDRRPNLRPVYRQLVAFWGETCVYCGASDDTLDIEHIVPRVRGGSDEMRNLTLACSGCNSKKGRKTAAEFGHPHIHERAKGIH